MYIDLIYYQIYELTYRINVRRFYIKYNIDLNLITKTFSRILTLISLNIILTNSK